MTCGKYKINFCYYQLIYLIILETLQKGLQKIKLITNFLNKKPNEGKSIENRFLFS